LKKALNMWTLTGFEYLGKPSVEEIVESAGDLGYDGVEFCFDEVLLHPDKIDKTTRKRYVDAVASRNLVFSSVATGIFWKYNLGSPNEKVRRKATEFVEKGLKLAGDLGAKVLLVVPAVGSVDIPYEKLYALSQKSLKECSKWAEEYGVIIGVENVWNKFLYSPLEFKRFIQDLNHGLIRAYLDVGNVLNLGYPEHWIDLLGDLITMVHVKDFDLKVGSIQGFRHLLQGSMDWKSVMGRLRDVGYDGFLVVECPPEFYPDLKKPKYPEDGLRAAKDNAEALNRIFSEIPP